MNDAKIEHVGEPVVVSGEVDSVIATNSSPEDRVEALTLKCVF